jgi:hypothetical protein
MKCQGHAGEKAADELIRLAGMNRRPSSESRRPIMLRKLATTVILVLSISLALAASASAMFRERPPFAGARLTSTAVDTRYVGDPAPLLAVLRDSGGGGYATPPPAGSNVKVPGLQP